MLCDYKSPTTYKYKSQISNELDVFESDIIFIPVHLTLLYVIKQENSYISYFLFMNIYKSIRETSSAL